MSPIRVFVCESRPIVIQGLASVLADCPDLELAGAAPTLEEAMVRLPEVIPEVILVSEECDGALEARRLAGLSSAAPGARWVLWSHTPEAYEGFTEVGFAGLLDQRCQVSALLECLRAVARGRLWVDGAGEAPEPVQGRSRPRLTRRERDIVRLVAEGRKNREIGQALSISPGTVKVHLMHIFEKAGVEDRMQLALLARRLLSQEEEDSALAALEPEQRRPV